MPGHGVGLVGQPAVLPSPSLVWLDSGTLTPASEIGDAVDA